MSGGITPASSPSQVFSTLKSREISIRSPAEAKEEPDVIYFHAYLDKNNISFADNVKMHDGNTNEKNFEKRKEILLSNRLIGKKNRESLKIGRSLFHELQFEEAIKIYEDIISELSTNLNFTEELNRLLAIAHILLGNVHHQLNNSDKCASHYATGNELDESSIEHIRFTTHPGPKK